jgi:hypothetical protein
MLKFKCKLLFPHIFNNNLLHVPLYDSNHLSNTYVRKNEIFRVRMYVFSIILIAFCIKYKPHQVQLFKTFLQIIR